MNNKFHEAFEPIRATEELKQSTNAFIHREMVKRQRKIHVPMGIVVACCAMLFLSVCGIGGYQLYQSPVSYISVDVNPSVELALNYFDRVVGTIAYNDDGTRILENLNLKNKPYTDAVEQLLAGETFASYLTGGALLSFTVVSDKEATLLAGIQQCQGYVENKATCHSANTDIMKAAHYSGLSVGKYQAYLELSQYDKTITPEDCRDLSMREIRDIISQYINSDDTMDTQIFSGQGNGGTGQNMGGNGHGSSNGRGNENGHHGGRD